MNHRWIKELHDPILTEMVTKWKRTDYEIADEMGFCSITISTKRQQLGLAAVLRPRQGNPGVPWSQNKAAPPEKPNPLAVAIATLGGRLVEKPSGYWLDRRPVNLHAIVREANVARIANGLKPITGHPLWQA